MRLTFIKSTAALLVLIAFFASNAYASPRYASAKIDSLQAGSQYRAYPVTSDATAPSLTTAPDGYVPFHIEHYGRHGSRWLLNDDNYSRPVETLKKAQRNGMLTERGELLLRQLDTIRQGAVNRKGELSTLGHQQHRDIARRMVRNFPQVFTDGTFVDAKSTVVIRCILSMANEIAEMQRLVPGLNVRCDASRTSQHILAPNSSDTVARRISRDATKLYADEYAKSHSDHSAFIAKIFKDPTFAADSIDEAEIFDDVIEITLNNQSHPGEHPDIYDVFTADEIYDHWLCSNVWWYVNSGNTSLTSNRVPYAQRPLVRQIIAGADTAVVSPNQSVNLRFGHESILLPLAVFIGINGADYDTTDLDTLAENWRNYEIFPMGSNIQIVFYRPESSLQPDDVLVKVLLNEAEATLPLTPVNACYYRWKDLREHLESKLARFDTFDE